MKVRISILVLNTVSNSNHEIIVAKRGSETLNLIQGRVFVEGKVLVSYKRVTNFKLINVMTEVFILLIV